MSTAMLLAEIIPSGIIRLLSLKWKLLLIPVIAIVALMCYILLAIFYTSWLTEMSLGFRPMTKCYENLGCVNITKDWYHPLHRPFNALPQDRKIVNTTFVLFTKDGPEKGEYVTADDPRTISGSSFNAVNHVVFATHGFMDNEYTPWLKKLAKAILYHQGPSNVFIVDWGGGSFPPYTVAAANARLVGLEIAFVGKTLINDFGAKAEHMHIIGHSLGAHIASYAAEQIPELGIITGLDPAGPFYYDMPSVTRLDPSDAKFVQVIHTDSTSILKLGYGLKDRCGHVDFYPNNGKRQPGCGVSSIMATFNTEGLYAAGRKLLACSHDRAIDLFMESLSPDSSFVGYECPDYETFSKGQCFDHGVDMTTHVAKMGWNAKDFADSGRKEGPVYLITGHEEGTFRKYHYHVKLRLANPSHATEWLRGKFTITMHGSLDTIRNRQTMRSDIYYHGKTYDFLITSDIYTGQVNSIGLRWDTSKNYLRAMCLPFFCNYHVFIRSVDISVVRHSSGQDLQEHKSHMVPVDGSDFLDLPKANWKSLKRA